MVNEMRLPSETGVTVLIAAHNEEKTIGEVVKACLGAPSVNNVWVVADKCDDTTANVAYKAGGRIIKTPYGNKGSAVYEALHHCNDYVLLMDADLEGLRPDHVENLATQHPYSMVVGIRGKEVHRLKSMMPFGDMPIGGERRVPRDLLFEANINGSGYRMEMKINKCAKKNFVPVDYVWMDGVGQVTQYKKWDFRESVIKDVTRWKDVFAELVNSRPLW